MDPTHMQECGTPNQYTISPVGQGLQGRGIFLHILVLHDICMNICTNIQQLTVMKKKYSYCLFVIATALDTLESNSIQVHY